MIKVILFYTKNIIYWVIILKIYLRTLGVMGIGILGLTLILTLLHYFNLIGDKPVDIIKLIIAVISIAAGGFIVGKSCSRRGWLEGIKLGLIIIVLLALLTLIFRLGFDKGTLLYYLIVLGSSIIGSMIGISIKEKKK